MATYVIDSLVKTPNVPSCSVCLEGFLNLDKLGRVFVCRNCGTVLKLSLVVMSRQEIDALDEESRKRVMLIRFTHTTDSIGIA